MKIFWSYKWPFCVKIFHFSTIDTGPKGKKRIPSIPDTAGIQTIRTIQTIRWRYGRYTRYVGDLEDTLGIQTIQSKDTPVPAKKWRSDINGLIELRA